MHRDQAQSRTQSTNPMGLRQRAHRGRNCITTAQTESNTLFVPPLHPTVTTSTRCRRCWRFE